MSLIVRSLTPLSLLVPPDQVAEVFAIVGEVAAFDAGLHPSVLLLRKSDSLASRCHEQGSDSIIILLVQFSAVRSIRP